MSAPYVCPGCGGTCRAASASFPDSVFTLNYVYRTRAEALAAPKAPVRLDECAECGLVHAPADDPMRSCYDADYGNTQEHSAAFCEHLRAVRALLGQPTGTGRPCRVLEVGCGKGGFLRLLCQEDGWSGDGYDTSYAGPAAVGSVRFHRQYVAPEAVAGERYDLVVCRHVVEHVPWVGEFLRTLAEVTRRTGAARLMLETPDFGWIAGNGAFWDVFHEHRNYFTRETLALLCQQVGLRVVEHPATFEGQYQNLLLEEQDGPAPAAGAVHPDGLLAAFHGATVGRIAAVAAAIGEAANWGSWAIWGAGAKGVCLANHLKQAVGMSPSAVFDINPAKQGSFLAGHGTPIVAPTEGTLQAMSLVVVANPVYAEEIGALVADSGAGTTKLFVLR